jgi:hypothetical protein
MGGRFLDRRGLGRSELGLYFVLARESLMSHRDRLVLAVSIAFLSVSLHGCPTPVGRGSPSLTSMQQARMPGYKLARYCCVDRGLRCQIDPPGVIGGGCGCNVVTAVGEQPWPGVGCE